MPRLAVAQHPLMEVPAMEPAPQHPTVALDDRDLDLLPAPLRQADHAGEEEHGDADAETDPRQHLPDEGGGVDGFHLLIVEEQVTNAVRRVYRRRRRGSTHQPSTRRRRSVAPITRGWRYDMSGTEDQGSQGRDVEAPPAEDAEVDATQTDVGDVPAGGAG